MEEQFSLLLEKTFSHHGFPLTTEQIEQLTIYRTELQRWNEYINLTAIEDDSDVVYKHFLDSVGVLDHCDLKAGHNVIDIGSGAGFPGVVIKVYMPDIRLTLIEASEKKVSFLKYLVSRLGFDTSVNIFAKRAEMCVDEDRFIRQYDWVLTRYVASLNESARYCLPMLKPTGRWVAYKSGRTEKEIVQSEDTLERLEGKIESVHKSNIAQINRSYLVISRIGIGR